MVGSLGLLILVFVIAAMAAPAEKTPAAKTAAPAVTHHRRHLTNQQKGAREMHSIFKTCRSWARQGYSLREVAGLMSAYNRANGFHGAVADYTITTCAGGLRRRALTRHLPEALPTRDATHRPLRAS